MAKKLSSVLGVDLGSQFIKVAEVRLQGRTPVVTALGIAQTPDGCVDHIGVHDAKAVGTVLKQLIASCGASVGDVVISLAGQGSVLVRTLEVPTMNDSELKQHMEWEVQRNIPFSESTVVHDFKAFPPEQAGAANMDVVMAIAPQSVVEMMVELVKASGKKAAAFDVEPLSLARLLKVCYEGELGGKTVCVVEMGHRTTAINMYKDGKLMMPRQVPIGGEMFTRTLADNLGVTFAEAETLKTSVVRIPDNLGAAQPAGAFNPFGETQAFAPYNPFADQTDAPAEDAAPVPAESAPSANPDEMRYYNAIAPVVDEFLAEIRRSVDYFRSKGGEVDEILLCGGASKLKGLSEFVEAVVGIPTEMMDPMKGMQVEPKRAESNLSETKQDYAVAVGNGLHICF